MNKLIKDDDMVAKPISNSLYSKLDKIVSKHRNDKSNIIKNGSSKKKENLKSTRTPNHKNDLEKSSKNFKNTTKTKKRTKRAESSNVEALKNSKHKAKEDLNGMTYVPPPVKKNKIQIHQVSEEIEQSIEYREIVEDLNFSDNNIMNQMINVKIKNIQISINLKEMLDVETCDSYFYYWESRLVNQDEPLKNSIKDTNSVEVYQYGQFNSNKSKSLLETKPELSQEIIFIRLKQNIENDVSCEICDGSLSTFKHVGF